MNIRIVSAKISSVELKELSILQSIGESLSGIRKYSFFLNNTSNRLISIIIHLPLVNEREYGHYTELREYGHYTELPQWRLKTDDF